MVEKKKVTSFDLGIELCKRYVEEFGNLTPKRTYVTEDGYPFGRWILYQREKRNKNLLTDEQITALEEQGMVWSIENHGPGQSFESKFNDFKKDIYATDDKSKRFAQDLRSAKRGKGQYSDKLTAEMISELIDLGFDFKSKEDAWNDMYCSILSIFNKDGKVDKTNCSDVQLTWIRHQKEKFDTLSTDNQKKLFFIGVIFNADEELWNQKFEYAREYFISHGHLIVPYETVVDNIRLGEWITRQRKKYANGTLNKKQIESLESIDMIWDLSKESWMQKYSVAKEYFENFGTLDVPAIFKYEGIQLGTWIQNQKRAYWNGTLNSYKKELLDKININWEHKYSLNASIKEKIVAYYLMQIFDDIEFSYHADWLKQKELDIFIPSLNIGIEYDGAKWHTNEIKDIEKDQLCESNGVHLVRIREPNLPTYKSTSLKLVLKDLSSKSLCDALEQLIKCINLTYQTDYEISINFNKDYPHIVQLFALDQDLESWNKMYNFAKQYYEEFGNLLVPIKLVYKGSNLGTWIKTQRQACRSETKYLITPKQIELLNQIGMVWDVYDYQFDQNYELAKKMYERDGKLVLNKHAGGDVAKVANWEYYTRRLKQDGKLSPDKLAKYNEIEALITKDEEQ